MTAALVLWEAGHASCHECSLKYHKKVGNRKVSVGEADLPSRPPFFKSDVDVIGMYTFIFIYVCAMLMLQNTFLSLLLKPKNAVDTKTVKRHFQSYCTQLLNFLLLEHSRGHLKSIVLF